MGFFSYATMGSFLQGERFDCRIVASTLLLFYSTTLQVALTEALAASQELWRQNQISMDRVITNKFDPP